MQFLLGRLETNEFGTRDSTFSRCKFPPPSPLKDVKEVILFYFVLCSTVQHRQGSNTEGTVCGGSTFIFHKIITHHFVISCTQSSGSLKHQPSGTWHKRCPMNETFTLRLKNNPRPIPLKKHCQRHYGPRRRLL